MKKQLSIGTLALLLGLGSGGAAALSDKEVEKRLDRLEKKVKNVDKRSEKRFSRTNSQMNKYLERMKTNGFVSAGATTSDSDTNLKWMNITDEENHTSLFTAGLQFQFAANDKTDIVLQLVADEENGDTVVEANWAYISYEFMSDSMDLMGLGSLDGLSVRAGRLRLPWYQASEYLEVGYAYPWISPPTAVYGFIPFDDYFGVDLAFTGSIMDVDTEFKIIRGQTNLDMPIGEFQVKPLIGYALNFSKGPYAFRLSHIEVNTVGTANTETIEVPDHLFDADFDAFVPDLVDMFNFMVGTGNLNQASLDSMFDTNAQYLMYLTARAGGYTPGSGLPALQSGMFFGGPVLGTLFSSLEEFQAKSLNYVLSYNDHGWNIQAEGIKLNFEGLINDSEGHYLSVAKQLGAWTPYVVYGASYTTGENPTVKAFGPLLPPIVNGIGFATTQHRESTLGVRWDFAPGVALKLETQNYTRFKGTTGPFDEYPGGSVNVYTLALDAVF